MKLTEWNKDELNKTINLLYSLSCQVDGAMEAHRLERLAESLTQLLEDYS